MLTQREIEVVHFVAVECLTSKQTARRMGLSYRTIEVHRRSILGKTGLHTTCELVREWTLHEVNRGPETIDDVSSDRDRHHGARPIARPKG